MTRTVPTTTRAPGTTIQDPTYQNHSTETPSRTAAVPNSVSVPKAPSISLSTLSPATSNHSQHCKEITSPFFHDLGESYGSQDEDWGWLGREILPELSNVRLLGGSNDEKGLFWDWGNLGIHNFSRAWRQTINSISEPQSLPLKGANNKLPSTRFSRWSGKAKEPGMVVRIFNFSTQEAEADTSLWVLGQPVLHRELQASQGNMVRPSLKRGWGKRGITNGSACWLGVCQFCEFLRWESSSLESSNLSSQ